MPRLATVVLAFGIICLCALGSLLVCHDLLVGWLPIGVAAVLAWFLYAEVGYEA